VDGVTYTLAYDEENRIETVTDTQASQTWTFHYDGNDTRVHQVNPDGSQLLLLNGGRYHIEIAADTTVSTTRYYSIAGQRPAMRNSDGSINYLLGDHLGSVSTVVDASGQIVSQSRYLPFGELLWEDGASPTDYTYTGQRSLSDIGLMDYNARFYDPMLGRFSSPDSTIPDLTNRFDFNRYTYVRNNPTYYVDPNGEHPVAIVLFIIGMTIYMSQVPSDEVQLNPEETGDPAVQLIGVSFMGIGGDMLASTIDSAVYGGIPL
jgi:RHS repeat-associated protein